MIIILLYFFLYSFSFTNLFTGSLTEIDHFPFSIRFKWLFFPGEPGLTGFTSAKDDGSGDLRLVDNYSRFRRLLKGHMFG